MASLTRTLALKNARLAPATLRTFTSTPLRAADSHPNTSTPAQGDVKPTAWTNRRVQGKSIAPIWPWFALAEYRHGTMPPPEINAAATSDGRPPKPPTFAEK
ncbi:hypothetical protein JCM11641_007495 [Rhodosporidiobolus odoratus]